MSFLLVIIISLVSCNQPNQEKVANIEPDQKDQKEITKLVLVLGHEHCGAVKAAIDDVDLGNITPMLTKIKPAVDKVEYEGDRSSRNQDFVHMVSESNVNKAIEDIRNNSPILKEMEEKGEIKIVGGLYDMDNGKVHFLN